MNSKSYWGTAVSGGEPTSYPITSFPATAYLGNNRGSIGGSQQSQPSPMAKGIGQSVQFNPIHQLVFLFAAVFVGYWFWHLDNK